MPSQEHTVARLERDIGDALARCDGEALRRFFAEEFIGINPLSIEMTKAAVQAGNTRPGDQENVWLLCLLIS